MLDILSPPCAGGGGGFETLPMIDIAETSSLKLAGAIMTMLFSRRGGGDTAPGCALFRTTPSALAVTSPEGETASSCRPPPLVWPALESWEDREWPHGNPSGSGLTASGSIMVGVRIPAERCGCFDSRLDRVGRADFDDEREEPTLPRLQSAPPTVSPASLPLFWQFE